MSKLLKSKIFLGAMFVAALLVVGSTSALAYTHTVTLMQGSSGSQVMALQQALGITADGSFGPLTKAAVMSYQTSHGLTADGVVGSMTGASLSTVMTSGSYPAGCTSSTGYSTTTGMSCSTTTTYPAGCTSSTGYSTTTGMSCSTTTTTYPAGCTSTVGYSATTGAKCDGSTTTTTTTTTLEGGAGSLDDVQSISSLSDEEVAEGDSDKQVAGWTLTADNGSDLAISTMRLSFDMTAGTGSDKFDDYADKVTVWQGSTEVGSSDVADFSENSNVYSKTINLSGVTPIKADEDSDFYVTVDALGNIDSSDLGNNTWTMTLENVRFEDATGVVTTETTTGDIGGTTDFSFESLATATGTELKVSTTTGSSGDAVNDGHVVEIDTTTDTNDVPLLAFDLEATGDIQNIQDIPVQVTSTGTGQVIDIANSFSLWKDGTVIDSVNVADVKSGSVSSTTVACDTTDTTCWVHFDDVDFDLNDGDTASFVVKADINDTSATLVNGDTLTVTMAATDVAAIDAEDANGDSVGTGDLTGTATADSIAFYTEGIMVSLVSVDQAITHTGDPANVGIDQDEGTYSITFNVTAFGDDMTVDHDAPLEEVSNNANSESSLSLSGTAGLTAIISSPSGASDGTNGFLVEEGTTEKFMITAHVVPTVSGYSKLSLLGVSYAIGSDADGDTDYAFNLNDFKTSDLYLNVY